LVEALAAGATVIASNLASFEEVVGDAGYLFRNEDPAHLAQTIENALGIDRTIAARTRAAAFDWNVIVPQLEEIYDLASSNQPKVNLVRRLER
jgi:phosphatidylinositol alpha-mannosyltransferase